MTSSFQLRPASDADRTALVRLAALDDAEPLHGAVMMAFADGEPVAAMSADTGRFVADPFRYTTDAVDLLRHRARQQRRSGTSGRGGFRLSGLHRVATG
jgi:hypothetical protein